METRVRETFNKQSAKLAKQTQANMPITDKVLVSMKATTAQSLVLLKNPQFQTITLTTAGGTVTFGAVGGAFGTAAGVVTGSAIGVVPALVTFGLSIPVGGVIGGGVGLCGGVAAGAGTGAVGGAAVGCGAYKYRIEIKNGVVYIKKKAVNSVEAVKANTKLAIDTSKANAIALKNASSKKLGAMVTYTSTQTGIVLKLTRTKAGEGGAAVRAVVVNPKFQVSMASAAAGTVVGGVTGGGVGTITGGVIGAAVGVVPALFTFGLSIPVGAAIGGGVGLCTGTVTGGSIGAVGAGAAGYGSYTYRKEISDTTNKLWTNSCNSLNSMKTKAKNTAMDVKGKISSGWTGGTA